MILGQENGDIDEESIPLNLEADNGEAGAEPVFEGADLNIPLGSYVQMLLVLACVVGAIYLLFYLLKKGARRNLPDNGLIRLLSSFQLHGNNMLFLVEVGTNIYLVSTGDGKTGLVAEITDKESLDTIRLAATENRGGGKRNFNEILLNLFKSPATPKDGADKSNNVSGGKAQENPLEFMKKQRGRLENLR